MHPIRLHSHGAEQIRMGATGMIFRYKGKKAIGLTLGNLAIQRGDFGMSSLLPGLLVY